MYILDKNKDYYDYLSRVYGVDKTITYDRRGSTVISDEQLLGLCVRGYRDEKEAYVVLEVGYIQYIFKFSNIQYRVDPISLSIKIPYKSDLEILHVFRDNKHYFDKEITLCNCDIRRTDYSWKTWRKPIVISSFKENVRLTEHKIENPILRDTSLVRHIKDLDIWKELSTFISSKYNDKTIAIKNTDKDLIVNHGFDVKSSFRHPVKWSA